MHRKTPEDTVHYRLGIESSLEGNRKVLRGQGGTEPLGPLGWVLFCCILISVLCIVYKQSALIMGFLPLPEGPGFPEAYYVSRFLTQMPVLLLKE